jgi:hypothetical protein
VKPKVESYTTVAELRATSRLIEDLRKEAIEDERRREMELEEKVARSMESLNTIAEELVIKLKKKLDYRIRNQLL